MENNFKYLLIGSGTLMVIGGTVKMIKMNNEGSDDSPIGWFALTVVGAMMVSAGILIKRK